MPVDRIVLGSEIETLSPLSSPIWRVRCRSQRSRVPEGGDHRRPAPQGALSSATWGTASMTVRPKSRRRRHLRGHRRRHAKERDIILLEKSWRARDGVLEGARSSATSRNTSRWARARVSAISHVIGLASSALPAHGADPCSQTICSTTSADDHPDRQRRRRVSVRAAAVGPRQHLDSCFWSGRSAPSSIRPFFMMLTVFQAWDNLPCFRPVVRGELAHPDAHSTSSARPRCRPGKPGQCPGDRNQPHHCRCRGHLRSLGSAARGLCPVAADLLDAAMPDPPGYAS